MSNRNKNIQDIKICYNELGKMIDDKEIINLSNAEISHVAKTLRKSRDYLIYNHIK